MASFEDLLGELLGGAGSASSTGSPLGGMLMSLFNGMPGGMNSSGVGGLPGLVSRFEAAGLGNVVQSWIGGGPNQQVAPEQLRHVLGEGQVNSMAQHSGMEPQDMLTQLAQLLPGMVDRMTPNGRLPTEGEPHHASVANPFGGGSFGGGTAPDAPPAQDDPWAGPGR